MNRKVLINSKLQHEFQEKGYVKLPLLSADEVKAITDFIETLKPDDSFQPTGKSINNRSTYHCSFLDTNLDYKRKVREFLVSVFQPHTDKILYDYEILNINFYVKQPGSGVFQIHQNWPCTPIDDTSVTVWCPLLDVNGHNGGIQVVEASHKIVPDIASIHAPVYFRQFEETLKQDYLRPVPMNAGEGLIFDDSLIHWSSDNNSDKPRFAIQIELLPNGVTPRYYHYDKATDYFEVCVADAEFYVSHNMTDLLKQHNDMRLLGYVKNTNRELNLEEFKIKMKEGAKTREDVYASSSVKLLKNRNSVINRFKNMLKEIGV